MKRLGLIMAMGAILALSPLTACNSGSLSAAAVSATSATPAQAHTVAAAENLYTLVAHAATVYVKSGKASPLTVKAIGDYDNQAYSALVAARKAAQSGNSALIAAALEVWNSKYGDLSRYLGALGVTVPTQ